MDIEINEVQEIIKNLESGGELSIKEEKYLKVAKLCVQLAAERDAATLEYDYLNDQIEFWKNKSINITEQRNELAAENVALKSAVTKQIELRSKIKKAGIPPHADFWVQSICEAEDMVSKALNETPATDRIVAGIKADGVEEFAKHCDDGIGFVEPEDEELYTLMEEQAREFAKQLSEGANHD